jgi:hypothetical protein
MVEAADLLVRTLRECRIGSPLQGLLDRRGMPKQIDNDIPWIGHRFRVPDRVRQGDRVGTGTMS